MKAVIYPRYFPGSRREEFVEHKFHLIICIFKLMLIFIDIDNIIICVEFYFTTLDCLLQ